MFTQECLFTILNVPMHIYKHRRHEISATHTFKDSMSFLLNPKDIVVTLCHPGANWRCYFSSLPVL